MLGAGSLLESETERSTEGSLETIGERLSGELSSADRIATKVDDEVTLRTSHPQRVASSTYTVKLHGVCDSEPDAPLIDGDCLALTADNEDVTVFVPSVSLTEPRVRCSEGTAFVSLVVIETDQRSLQSQSGQEITIDESGNPIRYAETFEGGTEVTIEVDGPRDQAWERVLENKWVDNGWEDGDPDECSAERVTVQIVYVDIDY